VLEKLAMKGAWKAGEFLVGYEAPVDPPGGIHINGRLTWRRMLLYVILMVPFVGIPLIWWSKKFKEGRAWFKQHGFNYKLRGYHVPDRPFLIAEERMLRWSILVIPILLAIVFPWPPFVVLMLLWYPFMVAGSIDYVIASKLVKDYEQFRRENKGLYKQLRQENRAQYREDAKLLWKTIREPVEDDATGK
jgi:hypothetical protein